jgi:PAS domain S-box-containing protein
VPSRMSHATSTRAEFERLVDLSLDMLCVTTLSSRFLVVNPAWTLTLGWSEEELRDRRFIDLVHPEDRERSLAEAARAAQPGTEVQDFEVRVRHRDGSYRWILWSSRSDGERLYVVARDVTHHKFAHETLRKSEQWLRKLVETAHEGIWVLDADDRTSFVNDRLAAMLGYEAQEMIGRPVYDFLTEHGRSLARSRLGSRRRGVSDSQEVRLIRKDGSELWGILSGGPLTEEDGSYTGSLDMLVDISERRGREQALRASEERYRNIVETTSEGVWMIDADHRTTYVNRRMAQMLGYTIAEMLGRSVADFVPAARRPEAEASLERRREGISEQREIRYLRKDGTEMWGLMSGSPLTNGNGGYGGALAMVHDITERKEAELELARAAAIVESSADAIFSTDMEGTITSWNRAAEELYGWSEAEAVGQSAYMLAPPEQMEMSQQMAEFVRRGGSQEAFRTVAYRKDGGTMEVEPSVSAIKGPGGTVVGVLAIVRAVS